MDEKISKIANLYVATLRSLYLIQTNAHWCVRGKSFYGDHLLFERLYKNSAETADLAAEKMVGLFNEEGLDMESQADFICKLLSKYRGKELHKLCLKMEQDFLAFSEQAYEFFEDEGLLTLGLDDMIMSIASKHEEACYLLQQALAEEELDALD